MSCLKKCQIFFTARADTYDCHMLEEVGGCRECYQKLSEERRRLY